jgi:predicted PhzF superfamily epimerase YddE/YHI9
MNPPLFHVDAFASRPFTGNPAAVCLLEAPAEASWMQAVAAEMNLSETAFVVCGRDPLELRWFTPRVEVDLCGHATLAAAHVLWETGRLGPDAPARFATRSGLLIASRREKLIELDFPATRCVPAGLPEGYLPALGIASPLFTGLAAPRHVVEVASVAIVTGLSPDFVSLGARPGRGVAVTARGDGRPYDFVSRYFAPWVGVNEDPVTGSVHCALATYWAERLGRRELTALQASPRGGTIRLRVEGERVYLAGGATTVARGECRV